MHYPFKIIRITGNSEQIHLHSKDRFSACCESMARNIGTHGTLFIVAAPNGKRMTIKQQRNYLSFSQGA